MSTLLDASLVYSMDLGSSQDQEYGRPIYNSWSRVKTDAEGYIFGRADRGPSMYINQLVLRWSYVG